MNETDLFKNKANSMQIYAHLNNCGPAHRSWIERKISLADYSNRLASRAENLEVWNEHGLVALLSYYINRSDKEIFVTNVSVDVRVRSRGLATRLLQELLIQVRGITDVSRIRLEVEESNGSALRLYERFGFFRVSNKVDNQGTEVLVLTLKG